MQAVLSREEKGRLIAKKPNQILQEGTRFYKVASQSGHGMYDVTLRQNGNWICTCPDFIYRSVVSGHGQLLRCKHIIACQIRYEMREKVRENVVIEPVTISSCVACGSSRLKKFGFAITSTETFKDSAASTVTELLA
jgi:predicted nucleic acid-binding Zn finger protein